MEVEYIGYGNCSGFGIAATDYVLALDSVGVDVKFRPIDAMVSRFFMPDKQKKLDALRRKRVSSNAIQIFHCVPDQQRRYFTKKNKTVCLATFESTKMPSHWHKYISANDLVITPSEFCFNTFKRYDPITVPHALDFSYWSPREPGGARSFTFMAVGAWKQRKGWHELALAWKDFPDCHLKIITDMKDKARIKFGQYNNVSYHTKIQDMAEVMSTADCIVCPTKGEGFGLVGAQALSLQIPLVVTDWSGVQEYANTENATMVPAEIKTLPSMDNLYQFKKQEWAIISPDILSSKMREVIDRPNFSQKKAQRGCKIVRDELSYERVGHKFSKALETLNP